MKRTQFEIRPSSIQGMTKPLIRETELVFQAWNRKQNNSYIMHDTREGRRLAVRFFNPKPAIHYKLNSVVP